MKKLSTRLLTVPLALVVLGAIGAAGLSRSAAIAQQTQTSGDESWGSSVKRGFSKIGNALQPKKTSPTSVVEDDAISLKTKSKPGPNLYVAVARLYMQSGKFGDAEKQFELALNEKRDYLPALLGYAELKEQMKQPDAAIRYYKKAVALYPQEASIYNNMGLCFARQGRFDEAVSAMNRATQYAPSNVLYQNNIAAVLVDQGKLRDAYEHLRQVHEEGAAYYNLAYLLNRKGQTQAAMQHFSAALRADPTMGAAQQWIEFLQKQTTETRLPQHPAAGGVRITGNSFEPDRPRNFDVPPSDPPPDRRAERRPPPGPTARAEEEQPSLPEAPLPPRRLPPVPSREPQSDGPSLPGISYDENQRPAAPDAPLPPASDSNIRPLPRA